MDVLDDRQHVHRVTIHARFDGVNGRNMAFACQPRRSRTVDVAKLVPRAFAAASAALVRC
jgi:hypothetical protein